MPNEARPDRADGNATLPTEVPPPGTIWLTLFRVMLIATTKGYGAASPRASGSRRRGSVRRHKAHALGLLEAIPGTGGNDANNRGGSPA